VNRRSVLIWGGQAVLAIVMAVFVWRALSAQWDELKGLDFDLDVRVGLLMAAGGAVLAVYAILIMAWRGVLKGWSQDLPFAAASSIWCVSNLGRYLPGKVWSVAGLAVLAQRQGVSAWAAVGSALTMQALSLGSGVAVVALTVPAVAPALQLSAAGAVVVVVLVVLVSPTIGPQVIRLVGRGDYEYHPLPIRVVVMGLVATALAWIGYGVAFKLLIQGLVPNAEIEVATSIGVFAAGYIVGFLALFAPGGLGVREAVYMAMLMPILGGSAALAVSVASRILLTVTEVVAALAGLTLSRKGNGRRATRTV